MATTAGGTHPVVTPGAPAAASEAPFEPTGPFAAAVGEQQPRCPASEAAEASEKQPDADSLKASRSLGMEAHREALKKAIESFPRTPALFRRRKRRADGQGDAENVNSGGIAEASRPRVVVPCWKADPQYETYRKLKSEGPKVTLPPIPLPPVPRTLETTIIMRQSVHKVSRQKGVATGRTYTSQYRGVHQTFPTRRWEAQFRRAGKPTSLGCFDEEEEAARAYDRMMIWCDLHNAEYRSLGLTRNGVTNFPPEQYTDLLPQLAAITQDDLVQELRAAGRMQAVAGNAGGGGGSASKRQRAPAGAERPGSASAGAAAGGGGADGAQAGSGSGGESDEGRPGRDGDPSAPAELPQPPPDQSEGGGAAEQAADGAGVAAEEPGQPNLQQHGDAGGALPSIAEACEGPEQGAPLETAEGALGERAVAAQEAGLSIFDAHEHGAAAFAAALEPAEGGGPAPMEEDAPAAVAAAAPS